MPDRDPRPDSILHSLRGGRRAAPARDLLPGIEARIDAVRQPILTTTQARWYAAAAIVLLVVNGVALGLGTGTGPGPTAATETTYETGLPRGYFLYR